MTQTNPAGAPTAEPQNQQKKRRVLLARVMIRGEGIIYERKKLWPQGPLQAAAAQCAYAVQIIEAAIARVPTTTEKERDEKRDLEEKLVDAKKDLVKAREDASSAGSSIIECLVGDMYLLDASTEYFYDDEGRLDSTKTTTPVIEILGLPFGEWEARKIYPSASIPQQGAFWENIWPEDEYLVHARELADADEDGDDDDSDEDGDDDDDDDDDDKGVVNPAAPQVVK